MITQKDLEEVVNAVNQVLKGLDERIKKLEEGAKAPSTAPRKKSQ